MYHQHSLRNPIVEQVVTETLRTVRDIWKQYGSIDEIHVELGREMKNSADKRKKMTQQISDNENTNLRIKALLMEFANPEFKIENVRSDLLLVCKINGKTKIYFIEVCNTKKFDIKKYLKLKESNAWRKVFPVFPEIIVISNKPVDTDQRLDIIEIDLELNNFNKIIE